MREGGKTQIKSRKNCFGSSESHGLKKKKEGGYFSGQTQNTVIYCIIYAFESGRDLWF